MKTPEQIKARRRQRAIRRNPLRKLTAREWLDRINLIPQPERNHVAILVWWDYFGEQLVREREAGFDGYLNTDLEPCERELIKEALIRIGYKERIAERRLPPQNKHRQHHAMYEETFERTPTPKTDVAISRRRAKQFVIGERSR